jgi:hypothetical protein
MAHDAAESVAPTNYYTEITVSERNKGEGEGWHDERTTGSRWTLDMPGSRGRKERTCCRNERPGQRALVRQGTVWVLRRYPVGEVFQAIWCRVLESVLFYVSLSFRSVDSERCNFEQGRGFQCRLDANQ